VTPLLNILPTDCGCGCHGNCQGDGTLGNLAPMEFDGGDLVGAGLGAGNLLHGMLGGGGHQDCGPLAGCFQCQMKGSGDISDCLDDFWLNQFPAMKAAVANGQVAQSDYLNVLHQTLTALSSEQLFSPQSNAYLQNTKQGIQAEINAAAAAVTTTPGSTVPAATQNVLGMPLTTILLFAGAGLVGFSLLKQD